MRNFFTYIITTSFHCGRRDVTLPVLVLLIMAFATWIPFTDSQNGNRTAAAAASETGDAAGSQHQMFRASKTADVGDGTYNFLQMSCASKTANVAAGTYNSNTVAITQISSTSGSHSAGSEGRASTPPRPSTQWPPMTPPP